MNAVHHLYEIDRADYLLGLLTLPAIYASLRWLLWLTDSTRSWHECGWCPYKTTTKWDRLKRLQMRRHEDRNHKLVLATFRSNLAEADEKGMSEKDAYFYAIRAAREFERTEVA